MRSFTIIMLLAGFSLLVAAETGQSSGLRDMNYFSMLDGNNIENWMCNDGAFITHRYIGSSGLTWPAGTGKGVIYASGPWVVGKVDNEIRSAAVEFSSELYPGRIIDGLPEDPYLPSNRIYKLEAGNTTSQDYLDWPGDQGAPVDDLGNPFLLGDQVAWWVANDADPNGHGYVFGTTPLYLEQQTYISVFDKPGVFQDMMVVDITLINHGPTIDSTYAAVWCDPDLGNARDDFVGYDVNLEMGYAWNDGVDDTWGIATPATGCVLLRTPTQNGEEVGITAFSKYINGGGDDWGDPNSADEAYNYMKGLNGIGEPFIDPTTNQVTTFIHPGDPVTGTGWIDPMSHPSDDRRFLMSAGPFDFAAGDTQRISFAYLIAQGINNINSITKLRTKAMNLSTLIREGIAADIEAPDLLQLGNSMTLESAWITLDPTVTDASLLWTLVSAPDGNTAAVVNPTNASCQITPDVEGIYELALTVTVDNETMTTVGARIMVVDNSPPTAAVSLSAGMIVWGDSLILDASESSDPDGDDLSFQWVTPDAWLLRDQGASAAILPLNAGSKSVQLYTTDPYFQDEVSETFTVIPKREELVYNYEYLDPDWIGTFLNPYITGDTLLVPINSAGVIRVYQLTEGGVNQVTDLVIPNVSSIYGLYNGYLYLKTYNNTLSIYALGTDWQVTELNDGYMGYNDVMYFLADMTLMKDYYAIAKMDFSNPGYPTELDVYFSDNPMYELEATDSHLFVLIRNYSLPYPYPYQVEVLDRSNFNQLGTMNLPASLGHMTIEGDKMYLGSRSTDSLWIYNIEDYSNPIRLHGGTIELNDYWPYQIITIRLEYLEQNMLALNTQVGVQIWDVSQSAAPVREASWSDGYNNHWLQSEDNQLFMLGGTYYEDTFQMGVTKVSVGPVAIKENVAEQPRAFSLLQNFPNPFNPVTSINFELERSTEVSLVIYDIQGRVVSILEQGLVLPGTHQIKWNGTTDSGERLGTGIYFCRLQSENDSQTIKMVYLK